MDDTPDRATSAFREWAGSVPDVGAMAPGRVNLVGGHVDYNDGIVLPVAIDRVTVAVAEHREDDTIRARSGSVGETIQATVGEAVGGWGAYVMGTVTMLAETTSESLGADILIDTDVPLGAGLSSSAALELSVAGALDALYDLNLGATRLADICWRAENELVGTSCGIMDQLASALGRAGHALRIDCRDRGLKYVQFDPVVDLLVFDSNVSHELVNSEYNDRVAECREAVARLDKALDRSVMSLRDATPEEVESYWETLGDPYARRARHVTTEIERVSDAVEALETGDVGRLGTLMRASHRSLDADYEATCREVNILVNALDTHEGVYGSRMVGGGWGGSVVALVAPSETDRVVEAVADHYLRQTGIEADAYTVRIGDGLRITSGK